MRWSLYAPAWAAAKICECIPRPAKRPLYCVPQLHVLGDCPMASCQEAELVTEAERDEWASTSAVSKRMLVFSQRRL